MRYVLAAVIACTLGVATASALPMTGAHVVSQSKPDATVLIVKRSHQATRSHAHRSRGDGGIHPLVGSGGY